VAITTIFTVAITTITTMSITAMVTVSITSTTTRPITSTDTRPTDDRRELADAGHTSGRRPCVAPPQCCADRRLERQAEDARQRDLARVEKSSHADRHVAGGGIETRGAMEPVPNGEAAREVRLQLHWITE